VKGKSVQRFIFKRTGDFWTIEYRYVPYVVDENGFDTVWYALRHRGRRMSNNPNGSYVIEIDNELPMNDTIGLLRLADMRLAAL